MLQVHLTNWPCEITEITTRKVPLATILLKMMKEELIRCKISRPMI